MSVGKYKKYNRSFQFRGDNIDFWTQISHILIKRTQRKRGEEKHYHAALLLLYQSFF